MIGRSAPSQLPLRPAAVGDWWCDAALAAPSTPDAFECSIKASWNIPLATRRWHRSRLLVLPQLLLPCLSSFLPWSRPLRPAGPAPPNLVLASSKATSSARTRALLNFDLCQQPEVSGADAWDRPRGQLLVLCVRTACTIELQADPGLVKVNYSDELVLNSQVIFFLYCADLFMYGFIFA